MGRKKRVFTVGLAHLIGEVLKPAEAFEGRASLCLFPSGGADRGNHLSLPVSRGGAGGGHFCHQPLLTGLFSRQGDFRACVRVDVHPGPMCQAQCFCASATALEPTLAWGCPLLFQASTKAEACSNSSRGRFGLLS